MPAPKSEYVAYSYPPSGIPVKIASAHMFYELWEKLIQPIANRIANRQPDRIDVVCETTHYDEPTWISAVVCATIITPMRPEKGHY
jgi:hypothetical protein